MFENYLDIDQVLEKIPIGKTAFYRWIKNGRAPKPLKFGEKVSRWDNDEIDRFIRKTWQRLP